MGYIYNLFASNRKRKFKEKQVEGNLTVFNHSGGQWVTPDTAPEVAAFYSGCVYIASSLAKLPWVVKDANNKILHNDPVTVLLNLAPNYYTDSMTFRLNLILSALIRGNGYAEIVRDGSGRVKALYPIPEEYVQPYFITEEDGSKRFVYKIHGGDIDGTGSDTWLDSKDIFHLRNLFTRDGLTGEGVAHYAANSLGISLGADRFGNSLYANGGMPSGILTAEGGLSDEARVRLKEAWQNNHGGRKVGGVAVLEEGLKFQPITFQPDALQFLETRKFNTEEIARFLRVPPSKLFIGGSARYANVEDENIAVVTDTLHPFAKMMELQTDIKILNMQARGRKSDIDLRELFKGDMKTRSEYYTKMVSVAAMSSNEIRTAEGWEEYEGGDKFYVATNNYTPIDRLDEVIDSQIESKNKAEEEKKKKEDDDKEFAQAALNLLEN